MQRRIKKPADELLPRTPPQNCYFGSVQTADALKGDFTVETDALVRERVHTYYWRDDINCAITTLKILSERFGIELSAHSLGSLKAASVVCCAGCSAPKASILTTPRISVRALRGTQYRPTLNLSPNY